MILINSNKLVDKLLAHKHFYTRKYRCYSEMPTDVKARCDEIDNCIKELIFYSITEESKEMYAKKIKDALEQLNLGPEEDVTVEYNDAVDVAIEALELQIPDKWQTEKFNSSYFSYIEPKIVYICPNCNKVADDAYKYCPHCGKAKIK